MTQNIKLVKKIEIFIIEKVRKILYISSGLEMDVHYKEFKQKFYNHPQLRSHFEPL